MTRRVTGFSPAVKMAGFVRAGGCCERCGEAFLLLTCHHRRPRQAGGTRRPETNELANLLVVDTRCHDDIESHRSVAYENGWLVRQSALPASVPVLYRGSFVLLDNDGGRVPLTEEQTA